MAGWVLLLRGYTFRAAFVLQDRKDVAYSSYRSYTNRGDSCPGGWWLTNMDGDPSFFLWALEYLPKAPTEKGFLSLQRPQGSALHPHPNEGEQAPATRQLSTRGVKVCPWSSEPRWLCAAQIEEESPRRKGFILTISDSALQKFCSPKLYIILQD